MQGRSLKALMLLQKVLDQRCDFSVNRAVVIWLIRWLGLTLIVLAAENKERTLTRVESR
jgi:hypothetical protein